MKSPAMRFLRSLGRKALLIGIASLIVILTLGLPATLRSVAASSIAGPNFAGTATSTTWTNPTNATGANNSVCATSTNANQTIDLTGFGFSIPAGSTITGVLVEPKLSDNKGRTMTATLLKAGVMAGTSKTFTPTGTTCANSAFTSLGADGDLWGATLTVTDVNATGFGVRIATSGSNSNTFLDAVRITVFYNVPTSTPTNTPTNTPTFTPTPRQTRRPIHPPTPRQTRQHLRQRQLIRQLSPQRSHRLPRTQQ